MPPKLEPGDVLTVWRLDRFGRSMSHLLATIEDLTARGVGFKALRGSVDTTEATGRLVLRLLASLAEFERQLIQERVSAGREAAKARGRRFGAPITAAYS